MRLRLFVLLYCFFSTGTHAATPPDFTGREYAEAMLLLNPNDFDTRLAAKSIRRVIAGRQNIVDLLAEVTWTGCSGKRMMDPDTLAWLAKALGTTKQARYAGLLDYCLSKVSDQKILKYMKEARAGLEGATTNAFVGGNMDLIELRARLLKQGPITPPSLVAMHFAGIREGQSLDEVYSTVGVPNDVSGINLPGKKVGAIPVRIRLTDDMLVLGYNGVGAARFFYEEEKANWILLEAKSEKGLIWSSQSGSLETFYALIDQGDASDLKEVVRRLSKNKMIERSLLDRVAERIYQSRSETDGATADALAHLCHVIEKTKDGRYKPVLLKVAESAETSTLRKHAGKSADALPETADEKFVPSPVARVIRPKVANKAAGTDSVNNTKKSEEPSFPTAGD